MLVLAIVLLCGVLVLYTVSILRLKSGQTRYGLMLIAGCGLDWLATAIMRGAAGHGPTQHGYWAYLALLLMTGVVALVCAWLGTGSRKLLRLAVNAGYLGLFVWVASFISGIIAGIHRL